jgi:uncharacterized protein (DUF1800 family)
MGRSGFAARGIVSAALWLATGLSCGGGGATSSAGAPPGSSDAPSAGHALRRVGYGPSPSSLAHVQAIGVPAWIEAQLDPDSIDESASQPLASLLAQLPTPQSEHDHAAFEELVLLQLVRAIYGERQLQETLTSFWENHFNTDFWKLFASVGADAATWLEWRENALFRQRALGRFEELVLASATSPAMLVMLDNVSNASGMPNENYARELLELHTLGADQGYTQDDVEELARCFTGWAICRVAPADAGDPLAPCGTHPATDVWSFHFDAAKHDAGAKTLFPGTAWQLDLPARSGAAGLQDGYDVIAHLCALPQTARFVSKKLIARYVADDPPQPLVDACEAAWLASGGDIRAVLRTIFESPEFLAPSQRWSKVRTPLESLCGTIRAFGGTTWVLGPISRLRARLDGLLNQELFRWPTPDGFPELGAMELGTTKLLGRIAANQALFSQDPLEVGFDLRGLLVARGAALGDADAVADALIALAFQGELASADRQLAIDFLRTDAQQVSAPLDPSSPDYDARIAAFASFLASLPQAVQQ